MLLVITYDISSNRRRARLSKKLVSRMRRVQKSVFEGPVPDADLPAIRADIQRNMQPHNDTVRIYRLCPTCFQRTELLGSSIPVPLEAEDVIINE